MNVAGLVVAFVAIYLVALLVFGVVAGRKVETAADYMVAGRKMPLYMTTATLFATYVCGGTIMGGAGQAYVGGFSSTIPDPFAAAVALVVAGLFIMKFVRKMKILSMGSFYGIRYGKRAQLVAALCMVPTYILFSTSQIMAIGKTFTAILGWDYTLMVLVGGLMVVFYTYNGGMLAVAWTDFFQAILLMVGIFVLFPVALKAAGGMEIVKAAVPAGHLSFAPENYTPVGMLSYLALWLGAGLGNTPCPDLMQRAMVAKDGNTAKWSGIISGLLMIGFGLLVVYIGAFGVKLVQSGVISAEAVNADPEMLVPLMAAKLMHPVILALFLTGLCGAIMSSADSAMFAPAAIVSNDLIKPMYKNRNKEITDEQIKKYTKWSVLAIGTLGMLLALGQASLWAIMVLGFILLGQMLFFPLFLGVYWKKSNEYGAVAGMAGGALTTFSLMASQMTLFPEPEWLSVLLPLAVSALATVFVSLATQKTCPPKPLQTEDGEIIKWPELAVKDDTTNQVSV